MRLLIDVNDVIQGQYASANTHDFVDTLREFDLNRHEKDRYAIVEIELLRSQNEAFLQECHS